MEPFWQDLRAAGRGVLMLDYDGTLAPLTPDRAHAWPYDGVSEALADLHNSGRTRLVVVSGRSQEDLLRLLPMAAELEAWTSHGLEQRLPSGEVHLPEIGAPARQGLAEARQAALSLGISAQLEVKPGCLALHWRGLQRPEINRLRRQVEPLWEQLESPALKLHSFDGGLELRSTLANKARAVEAVAAGESRPVPFAYLGDDLTDEDAFRALPADGLAVLVREECRPTAAGWWLRPPAELLRFLHDWELAFQPRV
jgi:trehalose-phosphatase